MNADGQPHAHQPGRPIVDAPEDDFSLLYRAAAGTPQPDRSLDSWTPPKPSLAPTGDQLDPELERLLNYLIANRGSDLHLTVEVPPSARIDGTLLPIEGEPPMDADRLNRMLRSSLNDELWTRFIDDRQVDYSVALDDDSRFRVNAFHQRGYPSAVFRAIQSYIPTLEELGVPAGVQRVMNFPYGLVLFVGPTGSGKSTTQAALISRIAQNRPCHILTIEDRVEYVHRHSTALVSQRAVGTDVRTFEDGLRAALREDPDVILLGEMRDLESISITLTLAETGHLVFATLHTNDAAQAIDRIVDSYPAERRDQIQTQLSSVLQGVVSQRLAKRIGKGRVGAYEVLLANDAVRNLIREGKTRQIRNVIATCAAEGMQTLESSINAVLSAGLITYEEAISLSQYPKEIQDPRFARAGQVPLGGRR